MKQAFHVLDLIGDPRLGEIQEIDEKAFQDWYSDHVDGLFALSEIKAAKPSRRGKSRCWDLYTTFQAYFLLLSPNVSAAFGVQSRYSKWERMIQRFLTPVHGNLGLLEYVCNERLEIGGLRFYHKSAILKKVKEIVQKPMVTFHSVGSPPDRAEYETHHDRPRVVELALAAGPFTPWGKHPSALEAEYGANGVLAILFPERRVAKPAQAPEANE